MPKHSVDHLILLVVEGADPAQVVQETTDPGWTLRFSPLELDTVQQAVAELGLEVTYQADGRVLFRNQADWGAMRQWLHDRSAGIQRQEPVAGQYLDAAGEEIQEGDVVSVEVSPYLGSRGPVRLLEDGRVVVRVQLMADSHTDNPRLVDADLTLKPSEVLLGTPEDRLFAHRAQAADLADLMRRAGHGEGSKLTKDSRVWGLTDETWLVVVNNSSWEFRMELKGPALRSGKGLTSLSNFLNEMDEAGGPMGLRGEDGEWLMDWDFGPDEAGEDDEEDDEPWKQ